MLQALHRVVMERGDLGTAAAEIADLARAEGGYRWVGVYEVAGEEIGILGWSGEGEPAYPRFPATQGLCGAAVAARGTVVVGDVGSDPRYLTTFGSTRSEIVVPVVDGRGEVVGIVDVESEEPDAFGVEDRTLLESVAAAIAPIFEAR